MQTAAITAITGDQNELPSMLATLCSYESLFGPYHPQTLLLMAQVATAFYQAGELDHARRLLERVVRDLGRFLGTEHDLRLRAIATLRDLFVTQRDYSRAEAAQHELLQCQIRRLGSDHPETRAARDALATILLENMPCGSRKQS